MAVFVEKNMSILNWIRKEPLIHFILIAIGLFILNDLLDDRERIQVYAETIDYLSQQRAELLLRELTLTERHALIQEYIDEEVLLREAYRQGLDKDVRLRQQLIKKMRFFLTEEIQAPTEAQLKLFYQQNKDCYRTLPGLTMEHIFFRHEDSVPAKLLEQLNQGIEWRQTGDFHPLLGYIVKAVSQQELARLLGSKAARQIFDIQNKLWNGPIPSNSGVHFIRIVADVPARQLSFNEVANYIKDEWHIASQQQIMTEKLSLLRQKYRIEIAKEVLE
jgi:hypothetical protein